MTDKRISTTSAAALEPSRPTGNNAPPESLPDRDQVQQYLWENSTRKSVRGCGRALIDQDLSISFSAKGVSFKGLMTCGSAWLCPCCAEREERHRAAETAEALAIWKGHGGQFLFATLTPRHYRSDPLAPTMKGLIKAWGKVIKGSPWNNRKAVLGSPGWIRRIETNDGRNGWHPHLHIIVFIGPDATTADMEDFSDWLIDRWVTKVAEVGLRRPSKKGQRVVLPHPIAHHAAGQVLDGGEGEPEGNSPLADYLDKGPTATLARQATPEKVPPNVVESSQPWEKTVLHWDVLCRAAAGDKNAQRLWYEFEDATKGIRQVQWSQHLRDNLGLTTASRKSKAAPTSEPPFESEESDSTPSAGTKPEVAEDEDPHVFVIEGRTYRQRSRSHPRLIWETKTAAWRGPDHLRDLLQQHHLPYRERPPGASLTSALRLPDTGSTTAFDRVRAA